jgi:hypothetical protein
MIDLMHVPSERLCVAGVEEEEEGPFECSLFALSDFLDAKSATLGFTGCLGALAGFAECPTINFFLIPGGTLDDIS